MYYGIGDIKYERAENEKINSIWVQVFFFAQHPVIYVPSQLFKNLLHCGKQLYNNIIIAMNIQVVHDLD